MNFSDPRVAENLGELSRLLAKTNDSAFVESFLRCLFTPAETADIAARWALVKALNEGKSQREIAKDLGLSLCKITRGSRELKKPESAFRRVLEALYKRLDDTDGAGKDPNGGNGAAVRPAGNLFYKNNEKKLDKSEILPL